MSNITTKQFEELCEIMRKLYELTASGLWDEKYIPNNIRYLLIRCNGDFDTAKFKLEEDLLTCL